jgi:methylenetetrahydrofolate--tRNA-(uracil-5-)-methyltransferase
LRQDNRLGTLFNMVGFQTKLKHGEQTRIFRMIPGLEGAEFARLGGLHRNTFLNSPKLLDGALRLKAIPRLRFAGQITGCEGYVESAAIGLLAGRLAAAEHLGEAPSIPPPTTAHGALLAHITGGHVETIDAGPRSFQPMNVNFGLFPPLARSPSRSADGARLRGTAKAMGKRSALTARALADLDRWRDHPGNEQNTAQLPSAPLVPDFPLGGPDRNSASSLSPLVEGPTGGDGAAACPAPACGEGEATRVTPPRTAFASPNLPFQGRAAGGALPEPHKR